MATIPEQKKHMKNYMEGKTSPIPSISKTFDGDESHGNRIGVNNFRNHVKNPMFYISVKQWIGYVIVA